MQGIAIGIDSVFQAPSGSLVAYGLMNFAAAGKGASHSAVALLRLNPFPPVPAGGAFPPGWVRVLSNPNQQTKQQGASSGGAATYGVSSSIWETYVSNGDIPYFFAGCQTAAGSLVSGAAAAGAAGMPDGWYVFRASAQGQSDTLDAAAAGATIPALGSAPGTLATDASDIAWAEAQFPTWDQGRTQWAMKNPFSLLTQSSGSTISSVAAASTPSSSQLILYALVAAGLALLWYET